jgi:alpha-tubulin suppressor-like RCC1 family protein
MLGVWSGWNHLVLVDVDGCVWGFGDAKGGKLGTGEQEVIVRSVFPPIKIAVGNLILQPHKTCRIKSARKV